MSTAPTPPESSPTSTTSPAPSPQPAAPPVAPAARAFVGRWWDEAWNEGLWAAGWSKSLDGLTPEQAAWSPAPGKHSIWQNVLHMCFWRESWIRRATTGVRNTDQEYTQLNFPEVTEISQAAWDGARQRFEQTQDGIRTCLADPSPAFDRLMYFLPHDCYHFGQINLLRSLQGLPPIE